MTAVIRTDSRHPDFIALVKLLDAELRERDGDDHGFYSQFNTIDKIQHVVMAYEGSAAVGCGAIKQLSADAMEVKRMYVKPEARNRGVAREILSALEQWAAELAYRRCVLETGKRQPEAIALYLRSGYQRIENYGQYAGVENSLCFEKRLRPLNAV